MVRSHEKRRWLFEGPTHSHISPSIPVYEEEKKVPLNDVVVAVEGRDREGARAVLVPCVHLFPVISLLIPDLYHTQRHFLPSERTLPVPISD